MPRLEAVRGIAILLVAGFHAVAFIRPGDLATRPGPLASFIYAGHTGVTLFFVLSAFLLCRPFLRAAAGNAAVSPLAFWQRRALRILPLYWVAIAVSSVLYARLQNESPLLGLPYTFFLNSFAGMTERMVPFSDAWWSLATEAQFYLLLPIVGYAARSRPGRLLLGVGFLAYCVSYALTAYRGFPIMAGQWATGLYGRLPAFVIGIGAAWIYDRYGERLRIALSRHRWCSGGGADLMLVAVIYALGLLLREVAFAGFITAESEWHGWHIAEAFCWAFIVLLVLVAPLKLSRVFDSRLLKHIGVLSYSIYLIHTPLFFYVLYPLRNRMPQIAEGWNLFSLTAVVLCIGLALLLSSLTYQFIERPFLERKAQIAPG